jgi:hypothetical protein
LSEKATHWSINRSYTDDVMEIIPDEFRYYQSINSNDSAGQLEEAIMKVLEKKIDVSEKFPYLFSSLLLKFPAHVNREYNTKKGDQNEFVARTNFGSAAYLRYETHSIFASPRRFQFTNRQTRRVLRVLRSFACGENFSSLCSCTDTHLYLSRYYTIHVSVRRMRFGSISFCLFFVSCILGGERDARRLCFERKSAARIRCGHTRRKLSPLFTPKYFNAHTPQMDECAAASGALEDGRAIFSPLRVRILNLIFM